MMARRRVTAFACAFSCAVVLIAALTGALTACSHSSVQGNSGLTAAGSTSGSATPGLSPSGPAAPSASPASGTTANGHPTKASGPKSSTPTSSHSASTGPDDTDYSVAWTNADCHWFVDPQGTASVTATQYITGNVLHTTGTIKSTVSTNGGGIPTGSETMSAKFLTPGFKDYNGYTIRAPEANFASHSITFTATLTFDGVPDQLDGDNTASLLIHFPTAFHAGNDGEENLTCDHVY